MTSLPLQILPYHLSPPAENYYYDILLILSASPYKSSQTVPDKIPVSFHHDKL